MVINYLSTLSLDRNKKQTPHIPMYDQVSPADKMAPTSPTLTEHQVAKLNYDLQKLKIAIDQQSEIILKLHSVMNQLIIRIAKLEASKMP